MKANMRKAALAIAACAFFVAAAGTAPASTIQAVDLPTLHDMSDAVVVAVVTGRGDGVRELTTEVALRVTESFKGHFRPGDEILVTLERGSFGDEEREVVGEADYKVGQRTLTFLQNLDGEWLTVALGYGKFDVHKDRGGRDVVVRSPEGVELAGGPGVDDLARPVALDSLRPVLTPRGAR